MLVFLLCGGWGGLYVLDLLARRRQIEQALGGIRYLRREIRCSQAPLHQILASESFPRQLPLFRRFSYEPPFDLTESYQSAKTACRGEMFFTSEEWKAMDDLFFSLGQGDCDEQERLLILAEESFREAHKTVLQTLSKNGKSSLVLGCCAGAVLVLLLL